MSRRAQGLATQIADQRRWIEEHGATLSGYIQRYGAKSEAEDPACFGNGGPAIYKADTDALAELEARAARSRARR